MRIPRFAKVIVLFSVWILLMILDTSPVQTTSANCSDVTETALCIQGTVIIVTTTTDELNNDGDCSLREAVQASNTDAAVDACSAGNGDDTIILSADTYTLSIGGNSEDANAEGDLDITGVLTITGAGTANSIIQAGTDATNGIDRVLHVLSSSNLTVQNVQIRYGRAGSGAAPHINGGGIYVAENSLLTVENCTIAYNQGANSGGVYGAEDTTVNINNSIISNNYSHSSGGGLGSRGTANIRDTTFERNAGIFGGAISVSNGPANIANSTFSENSAIEFDWRPPGDDAVGGAISNYGELTIRNSTISANTAINEGGGVYNSGEMYISNCTITDNGSPTGGGIFDLGGVVTVTNSIIAANAGGNCSGAIISNDYNIDSDNTCDLTQPNDQANIDPMLDSLADNGGPTWTHALSPGSLAINTGNCSGGIITKDQRGVTRPQGYACDIGAYEYDWTTLYVSPTDSACDGQFPCYSTIQDAVDAASDESTIKVAAGVYTGVQTRTHITQVAYISKSLIIQGGYTTVDWNTSDPDANPVTLDAEGLGRGLVISGPITATVEGAAHHWRRRRRHGW